MPQTWGNQYDIVTNAVLKKTVIGFLHGHLFTMQSLLTFDTFGDPLLPPSFLEAFSGDSYTTRGQRLWCMRLTFCTSWLNFSCSRALKPL